MRKRERPQECVVPIVYLPGSVLDDMMPTAMFSVIRIGSCLLQLPVTLKLD